MEAFTLLKFRRGSNSGGFFAGKLTTKARTAATNSSTIITAASVKPPSSDTDDGADDGPYFDLEFTPPDDESGAEEEQGKIHENNGTENEDESESGSDDESDDQEEGELKFELSNECKDQSEVFSPSDDLFFKGHLVPIEPSSILLNASESNAKFPASLKKSATKFRVLLLKLKKSKQEKNEANGQVSVTPKTQEKLENEKENQSKLYGGNKFFSVKFKVEEVPLVSLFTRDTSSKGNNGRVQKNEADDSDSNSEKKLSKETVQKYLKMVKPLYVRVSKRYGEKLKISGHLSFPGGETKAGTTATQAPPSTAAEKAAEPVVEVSESVAPLSTVKSQKQGNINLQAGLKVVLKHLGKNRPEVAAAAPPDPTANMSSSRRDDSLLQQQDGIQGAILHCKRSFNASREVEAAGFVLHRSASDPSHEKSVIMSAESSDEAKKKSLSS